MLCLRPQHLTGPLPLAGNLPDAARQLLRTAAAASIVTAVLAEYATRTRERPAAAPVPQTGPPHDATTVPESPPEPELRDLFDLFLGHRHQIEHTGDAYPWIRPPATNPGTRPTVSLNHDTTVGGKTRAHEVAKALMDTPGCVERTTYAELDRDLSARDMHDQFMYFWCHGHLEPDSARIVIRLTDRRTIHADTIRGARAEHHNTGTFHPLVLLSACRTGIPAAADHGHLTRALIGHGARGVLGPQIRMPQAFAAEYALAFVTRYLDGTATAGAVTHALTRDFAARYRNPLALAYALHSGMDTRLHTAPPPPTTATDPPALPGPTDPEPHPEPEHP
ncbi:CHAT domain-containing protein (plasmid) [Embleya sp. NBC_00896]|nr:CHAT domain-containing protein [Embleya sp. NBC_00896]